MWVPPTQPIAWGKPKHFRNFLAISDTSSDQIRSYIFGQYTTNFVYCNTCCTKQICGDSQWNLVFQIVKCGSYFFFFFFFFTVITSFRTFVDCFLAKGLIILTKLRKSDRVILKFVTHSSWYRISQNDVQAWKQHSFILSFIFQSVFNLIFCKIFCSHVLNILPYVTFTFLRFFWKINSLIVLRHIFLNHDFVSPRGENV